MKIRLSLAFLATLSISVLAYASEKPALPTHLQDLDPEATSQELQSLLSQQHGIHILANDPLDAILTAGQRNLEWVEFINQSRPDGQKLAIQSPTTQTGIPIDQANESNREIILKKLADLKALMPATMQSVLFDGAAYVSQPPIGDEDFLKLARKLDSVYNAASRWLLQEPYLFQYAALARNDIRGYYFLHHEKDIEARLGGWTSLDAATQAKYGQWMIGQCQNTQGSASVCADEFQSSVTQGGKALDFFHRYEAASKRMWDNFFVVTKARRDVTWTSSQPSVMTVPFAKPDRADVQDFLSSNIEDEWKTGAWNLRLGFTTTSSPLVPHVEFQAGTTPHANAIAGNIIVMDANRPLTEYTTRWTIRHEFGHIIGFPDCYVEFYDSSKGVMVNYQLDLDNLMCSRKGKFQQIHFDALKKAYFR